MESDFTDDRKLADNEIVTKSPLTKWYLTTLKGHKVVTTRKLPEVGSFGKIQYKTSWILRK